MLNETIEIPPEHIRISNDHDRENGVADAELMASIRDLEPIAVRPITLVDTALVQAFAAHVKGLELTPELLGSILRTTDVKEHLDGWELTAETMGEAVALDRLQIWTRDAFKVTAAEFGFKMPRKPKAKT